MLNILDKTVISVLHASDCKIPNLTLRDSSGYRKCEQGNVGVLCTVEPLLVIRKAHKRKQAKLPVFYIKYYYSLRKYEFLIFVLFVL